MPSIYGLVDPRTAQIRYVGKTSVGLTRRLAQHLREAGRGTVTHRHNWLRELAAAGHSPEIVLLEDAEDWQSAERAWIAALPNLTNQRAGGEGVPLEAMQRHADNRRGKKRNPEIGRKISEAKKGQPGRPGSGDHLPHFAGEENNMSKLTDALVVELRRHVKSGGELTSWAENLGVSATAASYAARGKTWQHVNCTESPTPHRARLTEGEVAKIRQQCESGLSQKAVADRFGISPSHVSKIVSRKARLAHVA